MKNVLIILLAAFALSIHCARAQDEKSSPLVRFARENVYAEPTREEAISMMKDSYHYMYFRNPADSVANLDRFIATIARIVPIDRDKERTIREQVMAVVRKQTDKQPLSKQIFDLIYSIEDHITLMGTNVIEVIRDNFDEADFTTLYQTMEREMRWAISAYNRLEIIRRKEAPQTSVTLIVDGKNIPDYRSKTLTVTFDYFGIE